MLTLLHEIARLNQEATAASGDLDLVAVAAAIERSLAIAANHRVLMLGLAEFIASSLDGAVPDPARWTPTPPSS